MLGAVVLVLLMVALFATSSFAAAGTARQQATTSPTQTGTTPTETEPPSEVPTERETTPSESEAQPVRELPQMRTATSDTYELSDGSQAQKIFSSPVNYRTSAGAWQQIEDQLVQSPDGTWQPQASPVPISLPPSLGSGAVSVGPSDRQISFQLQGASSSEGRPAGAQRIYAGALASTDVTYDATPQSLRETLTLSSAAAPSEYRYSLNLSNGLYPALELTGASRSTTLKATRPTGSRLPLRPMPRPASHCR
jgi:hypothetical protein